MKKNIHKTAIIGKNVIIECRDFTLGANSIIKDNCIIKCTKFKAGVGLYMCEGVEVGRGGCFGPKSNFGPVYIGNNVWLPARSIVLPNVKIGENTVIGIGSIINRSIPKGCFAAGSPCKVLKENCYPRELSDEEKYNILASIVKDYLELINFKGLEVDIEINSDSLILKRVEGKTIFNIEKRTIEGYHDKISEDMRDYLRRRGIKIFTKNKFKSI